MSQEVPSTTPESQINPPEKGEGQEQNTTEQIQNTQPLEGEALEEAVRLQLEYLLSRDHLATDFFLVSQMNSEMYVPLATLASICTLSTDVAFITKCMKKSTTTTIDASGALIKPNFKITRTTVILRDIPSTVEAEKVQEIFKGEGCPKLVSIRPDIGDCWFAAFETEEDTLKALEFVRKQSFNGAPVKARIKSENLLRSFSPTPPVSDATAAGGVAGYGGYYQQQMGYGYSRGNWSRPNAGNQQAYSDDKDQRRGGGRGNGRQRKDYNRKFPAAPGASNAIPVNAPNDSRNQKRRAGRGTRKQSDGNKPSTSPTVPAQFQLGHAHFPPLGPSSTNPKARSKSGYSKDFTKFGREELIGIVTSLDVTKQKPALPDSLPSVVLKEPTTELLIPRRPSTAASTTSTPAAAEEGEQPIVMDGSVASSEPEAAVSADSTATASSSSAKPASPPASGEAATPAPTDGGAKATNTKSKKRRNTGENQQQPRKGKKEKDSKPAPSRPGQTWAQVARPSARPTTSNNTPAATTPNQTTTTTTNPTATATVTVTATVPQTTTTTTNATPTAPQTPAAAPTTPPATGQ